MIKAPSILINNQRIRLIPYGNCACGCGRKTTIASKSSSRDGLVKGRPMTFIRGHSRRGEEHSNWNGGKTTNKAGYVKILCPSHPRADGYGYVSEHVLICEKALGKPLPISAEPHHVDGNKSNNVNTNLVLCQDRAYHMLLEQRTRAIKECGNANWRKCRRCQQYDSPENLSIYSGKSGDSVEHVACRNEYMRQRYIKNKE